MTQTCEAVTRKWGNSIGITFPKELVQKEHMKENQKIRVIVVTQDNTLKETFGLLKGKLKKSAQQIKDELRAELYDDE